MVNASREEGRLFAKQQTGLGMRQREAGMRLFLSRNQCHLQEAQTSSPLLWSALQILIPLQANTRD